MMNFGETLYEELNLLITEWQNNPPPRCGSDLYLAIITEHRTILMVFQEITGTVIRTEYLIHLMYMNKIINYAYVNYRYL